MLVGTESDMLDLGHSLAHRMRPGLVVLLSGELGVGKTTFVRGVLRGLGWEGEVRSPTFNLVHEYPTSPPVCHVDLYRLTKPEEVRELALEEYLSTHVVLVEWPERGPDWPGDAARVELAFSPQGRTVLFEGLS